MKIVLLWPYFHPSPTAAAVRGEGFAKYFARKGADVQVFTPDSKKVPVATNYEGIPILRIGSYENLREEQGIMSSAFNLRKVLKGLKDVIKRERPDIVITSTPSPLLAFEGHLACKNLGIPVVFDVRDSWKLSSIYYKGRLSNFIKKRIEGQCCWGARKVLVVTSMLRDHIIEDHGIPRDRIAIARNGADLEMFNVKAEADVDVIMHGAPSRYRNFERLFEAFSYLLQRRPSTTIRYLGWINNSYTRYLESYVSKLQIAERIELLPPMPFNEVPLALAKARIGVISMTDDVALRASVAVKTYEYMATGLPVACLAPPVDCELKRLMNSTNAGIYESDPKRFADRLAQLLDDANLHASFAMKSKKASLMFDRKIVTDEIYQRILLPIVEGSM